jgi:hypothetical protein
LKYINGVGPPHPEKGKERVGVLVDFPAQKISFYHNGLNLGVAFDDLDTEGDYYPFLATHTNAGEVLVQLAANPQFPPKIQDDQVTVVTTPS